MKTYSITDIGQKRSSNQDFIFSSEMPVGNLPNLFVVADGMGGHKAGDYASRCAVKKMVDTITQSEKEDPGELLNLGFQEANRAVIVKSRESEEYAGMGTTIVACTILGENMLVANVGDSRLYVNDQELRQITVDHSLVEEMIRMGQMDRTQAREHPDKHIITRAVGVSSDLEVDFFSVKLNREDTVLLCSDGLTNMVDDEQIHRIIMIERDVAEKAEKLVETANLNGGADNISVTVVEPFTEEI